MNNANVKNGKLIVISGPAGCGKDTIVAGLFEQDELYGSQCRIYYSVSTTTREIRPGEEEGKHYYFKSRDSFERLIERGEFLEHTQYCGNYYGTRKKTVLSALKSGKNTVLKIEVEGAMNIKSLYSDAVLIFIQPPSLTELRRRLENRSTEDSATIEIRLKKAKEEMKLAHKYDYQVINDDLQTAINEVAEVILKEIDG
jgi:guanylate kinase